MGGMLPPEHCCLHEVERQVPKALRVWTPFGCMLMQFCSQALSWQSATQFNRATHSGLALQALYCAEHSWLANAEHVLPPPESPWPGGTPEPPEPGKPEPPEPGGNPEPPDPGKPEP